MRPRVADCRRHASVTARARQRRLDEVRRPRVSFRRGQQQVIPRHDSELGRAYRLSRGRDWLDRDDAEALRALLDAYWSLDGNLPGRIRRALRRASHAATERYVDDRLAETAIALESLLSVGEALENDNLVHEAPAIVGRRSPSALTHAKA